MKASPPQLFGISSGMLRTFANVGMVFSFSMAIVLASQSIPRQLAFAIFVGSTRCTVIWPRPSLAGCIPPSTDRWS